MFLGGCPLGGGIAGLLRRDADSGTDASARPHRHTGTNSNAGANPDAGANADAGSHGDPCSDSCPHDAPCLNVRSLGAPRAGRG